jgi:hypothetical protein
VGYTKEDMGKYGVIKKVTKKWSSGFTNLAVLGDLNHPGRNYIVLQRRFAGQPGKNQNFNLHLGDWDNLKNLIDGELDESTNWSKVKGVSSITTDDIQKLSSSDPDLLVKVLNSENLKNLSSASFEALDRLALRVYEIKAENVDFLLKNLADAGQNELENFISVLNDLKIGQISTIAELVNKKCSMLSLLERLIAEKDTREVQIHTLLEENLWILDNNYDLLRSNKTLKDYLDVNISKDPDTGKRPDLIVKRSLQDENHIVVIELKRPSVKLKAEHLGQVLGYKGIIERHNPSARIDLFLIGYLFTGRGERT